MSRCRGCGSGDRRPWNFEREREECGDTETDERHEMIPSELLFEKEDCKPNKDDQCDHLLNDLELESAELVIAETIGGHRQAILEQCNSPRDEDRFPQRPVVAVFEVAVSGKGHEYIR
jgi:hypothetical protein